MKIYYLGPKGSYSHILTKQSYQNESDLIPCESFSSIIERVLEQDESIGVLPIENSITSNVHENIDSVFTNELYIHGEAYLKISLNLIGLKNSQIEKIKTVYSHPKALAQSSLYIKNHNLKAVELYSTAEGKEQLLKNNNISEAFIGSKELGTDRRLKILEKNIGNNKHNLTRFIFISKKPHNDSPGKIIKGTYIFTLLHRPGSLAQVLTKISSAGINLTKIESRPIPNTDWEYQFWLDFEFDGSSLSEVKNIFENDVLKYRLVGLYEKGKIHNE